MIYYYNINGKMVTAWKPIKNQTPLALTKEEADKILSFDKDGKPILRPVKEVEK